MADVPEDIQKILDGMDKYTCGCTQPGPKGKGICQCRREVSSPGEICDKCKKFWHIYN